MLWARSVMDDWIGEDGGKPQIKTLTAYFFALYFIMATQVCTPAQGTWQYGPVQRSWSCRSARTYSEVSKRRRVPYKSVLNCVSRPQHSGDVE